jgi:hypothetical protein
VTLPAATPLILRSDAASVINANTGNAAVSERLLDMIIECSDALQKMCNRRFDHRIATIAHTARRLEHYGDLYSITDLRLRDDLLSAITITNGDGAVFSSGYTLLPSDKTVKSRIHLDTLGSVFWDSGGNDPQDAITIRGVWGYNGDWVNTGATISSATNSATSLTVSSSTNLEAGMVLRFGATTTSEWAYLDALNGTTTITVERAYNGSTAAAINSSTPIYRYRADATITRIMKRFVQFVQAQAQAPLVGQIAIGDYIVPVTMDGLPRDIAQMIQSARLAKAGRLMAL